MRNDDASERGAGQSTIRPAGQISKVELARRLGIAERNVYVRLASKTTSRDIAEKIAKHYGGKPEDYLRAPRRRGRTRSYPFRDFIRDEFEQAHEAWKQGLPDDKNPHADVMHILYTMYCGRVDPKPPADFLTLESLLNFIMRTGKFRIEERDSVALLWKLFRLWREEQLYLERVFAIECGDAPDDFG